MTKSDAELAGIVLLSLNSKDFGEVAIKMGWIDASMSPGDIWRIMRFFITILGA